MTISGHEIRQRFLEYFQGKGHQIVASSSLVPSEDPTLLFTNAGMVQFKGAFLGEEKRPYNRATTSQKCMRVSGKHNDLEQVGRTPRHHTFFEMLGNFSFGDYFKEGAIDYAWEFFTVELGLQADKLSVTIFEEDDDAFRIWNERIGLAPERIGRCGEKDNFWAMGETGPCGPCSEIHIDWDVPEQDEDGDGTLELWNLVFMQFDRSADGTLTPLPRPSIDTGLGLERMAAVIQEVPSNYDTDLLRPLIRQVEEMSETRYGERPDADVSMRVIADHARATAFLLSDGVMPSNEGRGYVLRRILRRAARHGRMLSIEGPFLYRVCGAVVELMEGAYPDLRSNLEYIARVTRNEEERFASTLDYGLRVLEEMMADEEGRGSRVIAGKTAFTLYDTYGFPLDLTQEVAADHGFSIDLPGFDAAMRDQQNKARAAWKGTGAETVAPVYTGIVQEAGRTTFVGYDQLSVESEVVALVRDGRPVEEAREGDEVAVILEPSPFYAESGGQVGDRGELLSEDVQASVSDTTKVFDSLHVQHVRINKGVLRVGAKVRAAVDAERRGTTRLHHSATHLLQSALREVLGDHVKQAGSLVAPDRLRFDFSHFAAPSAAELERVEELVNEYIRNNVPVRIEFTSLEDALAGGATALFGEKYGDEVRMVSMGELSRELCGGTHVRATGDIGLFKIVRESSVAAGVRRIEALAGPYAYRAVRRSDETLGVIQQLLKARPSEEVEKLQRLIEVHKSLEREVQSLRRQITEARAADVSDRLREIDGVRVLSVKLEVADMAGLRAYIDDQKQRLKSAVIVAGAVVGDKVALSAGVTSDLVSRFHAGELIKEVAAKVGGSGGGRRDMAQAGGADVQSLDSALDQVYEIVQEMA